LFQCVAVTVDGYGTVWGFDSPEAARRHPIVQHTDPILTTPSDVARSWSPLFLPRMVSQVLNGAVEADARNDVILEELMSRAAAPPDDPAEICRIVIADRARYEGAHPLSSRNTTMTNGTTTAAAAPAAAAAAAPKTIAVFAPTAKISFGKDGEGNAYNAKDNNPKRAGSKGAERFAKYKDGMTVEEATKVGITAADLKWDTDKKFIVVK